MRGRKTVNDCLFIAQSQKIQTNCKGFDVILRGLVCGSHSKVANWRRWHLLATVSQISHEVMNWRVELLEFLQYSAHYLSVEILVSSLLNTFQPFMLIQLMGRLGHRTTNPHLPSQQNRDKVFTSTLSSGWKNPHLPDKVPMCSSLHWKASVLLAVFTDSLYFVLKDRKGVCKQGEKRWFIT